MRYMTLATAGIALALAACNPMEQTSGADELAEVFHEDFSAGNFDKIWNEASDDFRGGTPRAEFDQVFGNLHEFYGEYQGGSRSGVSLNTNNGVTTTQIGWNSTYANSRADETFIFIGTGDDMKLLNWSIEPVAAEGGGSAPAAEAAPAPAEPEK